MPKSETSIMRLAGGSLATIVATRLFPTKTQNNTAMPRNRASNSSVIKTTRRPFKKRTARSRLSFAAKSRALKPTKQWSLSPSIATMTHNTIYSWSPTQGVVQGTANDERIGDSLYLTGLRLKGFNITDTAANGYTVRILVGWTGEEYAAANTFNSLSLSANEIFLPGTGTTWNQSGIVNPKAFTLLHDQVVTMNSLITGVEDLNSFDQFIPINAKMVYQGEGSTQGKLRNLYVVVISNVVGGADGSTDTGDLFMSAVLSFKDSN